MNITISFHRFSMALALVAVVLLPTLAPGRADAADKYKRTVETYAVPDVSLVDQYANEVSARGLLAGDKPVLLDFVYATCTTICPVLSAGFSNFQHKMGTDIPLVSVSIDPEHDTPEIMGEYLERYDAQPGWLFLTGSRRDIDLVMRAFDAYVPNKMSHYPLTLIWNPAQKHWVRLYGLLGTSDLIAEYEKVLEEKK